MAGINGQDSLIEPTNHKVIDHISQDDAQRKRIRSLMESAAVDFYGILGGGFDPYDMYQDMSGWNAYPYVPPPWYRQSQKRGEVIPVYLDENQLRFLRDRSRKLWQENCFVRGAIANMQNYTVGEKGLSITAISADKKTPAPEQLLRKVQRVIDLWQEANELPEVEADIIERMVIDGEKFVRHFPMPSGLVMLRDVEAEHVKPPPGGNFPPHYSFGVQTDPDDIHTKEGYWVVEDPIPDPLPKFVPAEDVCHFKANTPRSAKRGLPLFYETEIMLRDAVDLLRGCVVTANIRARYAVIRKFASPVIKEAVNKFLDEVNVANVTDPTTGQNQNVERKPFGSVVNAGNNVEYDFPNANLESNQFYQALQMVLRAIAARICFPEFMLTADSSNAAYANILVAEAPSTKMFTTFQKRIVRKVAENRILDNRSLAWTQIVHAVRTGILPPETLTLVALQGEGATLVVRDQAGEAQTNAVYVEMGVKSKKTVTMEQNLDYDQEQTNIKKEQEEALIQQQRMVMAQNGGVGPMDRQQQPQQQEEEPNQSGEGRTPVSAPPGSAMEGPKPKGGGGGYSRAELMHGRPVMEGVGNKDRLIYVSEMLDELGEFYDNQGGSALEFEEAEREVRKTKPSKAKVLIRGNRHEINSQLEDLFPHIDDPVKARQAVAHVVGAPDDSEVSLWMEDQRLNWRVSHPDLHANVYGQLEVDRYGDRLVHLDHYFPDVDNIKMKAKLGRNETPGIGKHMMNKMATGAAEHGFDRIYLMAAGTHPDVDARFSHMTGSVTWPNLGFDARLDSIVHRGKGYEAIQTFGLDDDATLHDLLATKEGRDWWAENYVHIPHAEFDLSPGSLSHQILDHKVADPKHRAKMEKLHAAFPNSGFLSDIEDATPGASPKPKLFPKEEPKDEPPASPAEGFHPGWRSYPSYNRNHPHWGNPETGYAIQARSGEDYRLVKYDFSKASAPTGRVGNKVGPVSTIKDHPDLQHLFSVADTLHHQRQQGLRPPTREPRPGNLGQEGLGDYGNLSEDARQAQELLTKAKAGGFTYNVLNDLTPTEGFAVSQFPDRSFGVDKEEFGLHHLLDYAEKNDDLFSQPQHHFGAWLHEPSNKIILDVSTIYGDPAQAEQMALYHDQQDYYDLKKGESINVNPHATSGGVLNEPATKATTLPPSSRLKSGTGTHNPTLHQVEGAPADGGGVGREQGGNRKILSEGQEEEDGWVDLPVEAVADAFGL